MALPCEGREEWTLESTHDTTTDPAIREDAQLAQRRAQFTCYLKCPQRQECLDWALSFEEGADREHTFHIYGGMLARERDNLRRGLPIVGPARSRWGDPKDHYVDQVINPTCSAAELTEAWGVTFKSLKAMLSDWLWVVRVEQGDPAAMLHEEVAVNIFDGTTQVKPSTVRAA